MLLFIEFPKGLDRDIEYWTPDDRFCVLPTPEGWCAVDYLPKASPRTNRSTRNFSQTFPDREEAEKWCQEQSDADCVPDAILEATGG